ncbi:MAG: PEGA domain-containing protein [Kiritimatiellae bacterium]|nr:PEGA domain-containing protein [Kiritimatiellia bacterium]
MNTRRLKSVFVSSGLAGWACAALAMGLFGGAKKGQIYVATEPAGAVVALDGVAHGATPTTVEQVAPGRHLVVVRKEGYGEARRTVSLAPGQKAAVDLKLEPILGLVLMQAKPAAEVEMEGVYLGKTPLFRTDLPLGEHRLKFSAEGYQSKEVAVTVSDRTPQKVAVELPSDSGIIAFTSSPAGATVTINGARRGTTPCTVDRVARGQADIEVAYAEYAPHRQKIDVLAGETYTVDAQLKPLPGTLKVVSIPTKARIYLDNEFRGETPLSLTDLKPGEYRIRAEKAGHEADARTIRVRRARETTEEFRLARNSGVIVVVTEPAGVKVYLDGALRGTTQAGQSELVSEPLEIALLQRGNHVLQLARDGYSYRPRTLVIKGTELVNLHEKLTRIFAPDTLVRTGPGAHEVRSGVLVRKHPNGDIEIEVRPGIIEKIDGEKVYSVEPIKKN